MAVVESAGISDVGQKRKNNEDALYLSDELNLYIVSDGMGGHQAGEVASAMVIETISRYMEHYDDADHEDEEASDDSLSVEANRLLGGIRLANQGVYEAASRNEKQKGMGATVSAVLFTEDALIVANVGDSPIFLIHNGAIEQVSVTHNVITEQEAIDPEAARQLGPAYGHMLTRAMGIAETVVPDISEIPYFKGDQLVICSDGLTDLATPEEILDVIDQADPQEACQELVDLANARGGHDNITVITLKVAAVNHGGGAMSGLLALLLSPFKKLLN